MHRPALDGPGPDQRDLHHQVVEDPGPQPRQGGHLGPRLDLEHAHRIGPGQHLVHSGLGEVEPGEIHLDALVLGHQVPGVVQRREHAQTQQIKFHQTDCRTVVFVPLQDAAVLHARPLHRAHVGDRAVADHHAAGVDAHVPRQVADLLGKVDDLLGDTFDIGGLPTPVTDLFAPRILLPLREAQGAGHVAHRTACPVGDDVGHLGGIVAAVFVVDVLDDLFPLIGLDVDVDVGWPVAGGRQEPLEQQIVGHRVDRRHPQGVTDRGIGRRSPALAQNVVVPAELRDVVHHQEITRKSQLGNDFQLMLDLGIRFRRPLGRTVPIGRTRHGQRAQPAVLGVPVGNAERRQLWRDQCEAERALLAEFGSGGHHVRAPKGHMREQPGHLLARAQM